tara:strand:+ start:517 stop:855 length:339 start_codon:yes stop_codon:yes gene_type:complete
MAIKWSINQLDYEISKDSKSNVVTSVHWDANDSKEVTKDGEKVTYSGRNHGSIGLDTSDLSSFVEYDKLDEDTVVSWVKAKLGNDEVKSVEDGIANQIDAQENPTTGKGKPW